MLVYGYPLQKIAECLQSFQGPPGRLEKIANSKGIHIFVDYAHTPDALANVFQTLNEIKEGRLITVFGCEETAIAKKTQNGRHCRKKFQYLLCYKR